MDSNLEQNLVSALKAFPKHWDGKQTILEMRSYGSHNWKQMEWFGFYFQELCERRLKQVGMKTPGTRYGMSEFDGFFDGFDWDFKAHCTEDQNGIKKSVVICNDLEATEITLSKYGKTGLIIACGKAEYDNPTTMAFKQWVKQLAGGVDSAYVKENIRRGARSRLRKTSFTVDHIAVYILDENTISKQLAKSGDFQKGMRNSNGNPRRSKFQLNLNEVQPYKIIKL